MFGDAQNFRRSKGHHQALTLAVVIFGEALRFPSEHFSEALLLQASNGHCSGTPNPYNLPERSWQYTSNLYPCNAVPCWLLSLEERETPQYASYLYRSTPSICTAVRLPSVPASLLRNTGGWGFRKVPDPRRYFFRLFLGLSVTFSEHLSSFLSKEEIERRYN